MNILIPQNWLKEYLKTDLNAKEIQKYLSLSGPSLERIYDIDGEEVHDIEITTNRVDCMSIYGIAREALPILRQNNFKVELITPKIKKDFQVNKLNKLPKINLQTNHINRILTVVLDNFNNKETLDFIKKRLHQIDQNSHNAIIDITNYITHQFGHPCHCFDYDKIIKQGGEIIIKEAPPNLTFTTLDKNTYQTKGGEIVFLNKKGEIIDLPAIKGMLNTGVDNNTKRVLFWIESLTPEKTRFTSMTHAIRTQAALINEKGINPLSADQTFFEAIKLYQEVCQAKVSSEIYDYFPNKNKFEKSKIKVSLKKINKYLGIDLKKDEVIDILKNLNLTIQLNKKNEEVIVQPPFYRNDLNLDVDIIEEIARIYGYHNLPSRLNFKTVTLPLQKEFNFNVEKEIKHFLSNNGFFECYNYSMVSREQAELVDELNNHFKIKNPLTDDKVYLRKSLLPSLQQIFNDQNPNNKPLSIFEMANVYHYQNNKIKEILTVSALSNANYRIVKGFLENLLEIFYLNYYLELKNKINNKLYSQKADILINNKNCGAIFITKNNLTGFSLNLQQIVALAKKYPSLKPIKQTNPIIEDLTFQITNQNIRKVIKSIKNESSLVDRVKLKDIYKNNYTFSIHYLDPKKNLKNQDIEKLRKQIVETLETKLKIKLIGKLN